jgi:hypothetical protein
MFVFKQLSTFLKCAVPLELGSRFHFPVHANHYITVYKSSREFYTIRNYLQLCDNDIVSQGSNKMLKLMSQLSSEHLYIDAPWLKVMRTPASPELV